MTADARSLVLRLASPLQSWGGASQYNRRDTMGEPTKSGVIGLLAAAHGRRRHDPIEDLLALTLGVRTDQPGSLLRDYHTVSDYRKRPLLSAAVSGKGLQKATSPAKQTHVTHRFYLQDAVFVVAVSGPEAVLATLAEAVRKPAFPLALGRRACAPTHPLLITPDAGADSQGTWPGGPLEGLRAVPWKASPSRIQALSRQDSPPGEVDLPVTVDDPDGDDVRTDLPRSFNPRERGYTVRRVRQTWVRVATPFPAATTDSPHDPFQLLGW